MAVVIRSGPSDYSLNARNGDDWVEFDYSHPPLINGKKLKYVITGTGDLRGPRVAYQGGFSNNVPDDNISREHLQFTGFGIGEWSVQFHLWDE